MKTLKSLIIALLALALPAAAGAEGFNYDDETWVNLSEDDWNDTGDNDDGGSNDGGSNPGGLSIGFDSNGGGETTGLQPTPQNLLRICRSGSTTIIESPAEILLPLYRIGAPAVIYLQLQTGANTLELPHGIYIIRGRKYLL